MKTTRNNKQDMKHQTFEGYVLDWWQEFVESHESESKSIMETLIGEEETIENYLDEGETSYDWLLNKDDADEIYQNFFGCNGESLCFDDIPDTETFLTNMFKQAYENEYDFAEEFIEDMAGNAAGYVNPVGFFKDLSYGGCSSGMIGMFIYNDDCKKFYINHIDDLEAFVEDFEGELGEHISNKDHQPHYTFVCWLCYEEFAHRIGRTLFPETF